MLLLFTDLIFNRHLQSGYWILCNSGYLTFLQIDQNVICQLGKKTITAIAKKV